MNLRTRQTATIRRSIEYRRYGLTLTVPAALALSTLSAAPAWATTEAMQANSPHYMSAEVSDNSKISLSRITPASRDSAVKARAVLGLYRCVTSATCDIVNANMHFDNYSSVCMDEDCNFVSAADWEAVVLRLNPSVATLKEEYANAGQTFRGGLNMSQLWPYWRSKGIDGSFTTKVSPYLHSRADVQNGVLDFGALIAELVSRGNSYMGTNRYSGGMSILVVDGFDPKGPLVVYQARTIQMTWAQWNTQARVIWGITASTNSQTTTTTTTTTTTPIAPSTSSVTFNANGGSGFMPSETGTIGTSASLTLNTFTRSGFNFSGWNTAANGSGTNFVDGELVKFTGNATLFAQWTLAPTSISFSGTTSSNWSGYVLPTSTIVTYASSQWTVPILNCADIPNSSTATWVGTGGNGGSSGSLLQTGVEDDCVNGVQQDSGWWEIVPATPNNEQTFTNFPVNPGDSILAEVYQTTSGQWVTKVQDLTTGLQGIMETGGSWYVTTIANSTLVGGIQGDASGYQYAGGYTAEWIQEDVTNMPIGSLFPLANFGAVTFTNLETNLSSWSLPNSDAVEITDNNNAPMSVPGPVINDGFTVNYTGP